MMAFFSGDDCPVGDDGAGGRPGAGLAGGMRPYSLLRAACRDTRYYFVRL